ncbi:phenoloxidase 1-like [Topomyia yanbarensis]|uniref:phenoloxidase 1-like n=1 Tax=Topomyia yanbarensis TaxID=2498891 RepID=UPI00273AF2D0|nr:phenoloxidase 1-like [Topomyia yanbarensis]
MTDKTSLLALLQRPLEPAFLPKDDGKTVLIIPEEYMSDRYRPLTTDIQSRLTGGADVEIPVRNVGIPDIAFAEVIDRRGAFSLFIEKHRDIAGRLINLFLSQKDVTSLMAVGTYARERLNPYLFQYAMTVAMQHRPDTKDVPIPPLIELFPDQFVDPAVFPKLREEGNVVQQGERTTIDIEPNFTASDREMEQRLAYFREDIGVNLHHWHWHLVYPAGAAPEIVRKDRRGELFFYMHSQIIARYNVERFCNKLARVRPLSNYREAIPEAYFPKMVRSLNNRAYPARAAESVLRDLNRVDNDTVVSVNDLQRWTDRIHQAIDQGFVVDSTGRNVPLDEVKGIDILGDLVEASTLSVNRRLYGSLHNVGHDMLAYIHDPDYRYLEDFGVMGDVTTAMRDPVFYRWHGMIDGIFRKFLETLRPYTSAQLGYPGIKVNSINLRLNRPNAPANVLLTFWQKSQVDLAAGLDFGPKGNVFASFTHLQHAPFAFEIKVTNSTGSAKRGTARIFIAPKVDERGTKLTFKEQRLLFIELDKFGVNLRPGDNTITRKSDQSSVTIPYDRTFRRIGAAQTPTDARQREIFRFCGCGWPQHMLIPKGAPEGVQFDLFVMISNFADDTVNQEFDENADCSDAHSFCGLRDKLYPDKRPMGFPFERLTPATITTLGDFIGSNTNMASNNLQIKFTNTVIART